MGSGVPGNGRGRARGGHGLLTALQLRRPEPDTFGLPINLGLLSGQEYLQPCLVGELVGCHETGGGQRIGLVETGHLCQTGRCVTLGPRQVPDLRPVAEARNVRFESWCSSHDQLHGLGLRRA